MRNLITYVGVSARILRYICLGNVRRCMTVFFLFISNVNYLIKIRQNVTKMIGIKTKSIKILFKGKH